MDNLKSLSKSYINKCGDVISNCNKDCFEFIQALNGVSDWRSLHLGPLNEVRAIVKRRLQNLGVKYILAQRLKRMSSIIDKLKRFDSLELSRMQDIGGLRIVEPTIDDIKKVNDRLLRKTSTLSLSNEKDYINRDGPKADGYRSVHMIFKYKSKKHPELTQYNIEIQIRTKLQHCWGTTVETLGMIDKESYKTGKGEFKTKRFLLLVSALFALKEKTKMPEQLAKVSPLEIAKEIEDIDNEQNITRKLQGVVISIKEKKVNPDNSTFAFEI